jgi:hypothetical protein
MKFNVCVFFGKVVVMLTCCSMTYLIQGFFAHSGFFHTLLRHLVTALGLLDYSGLHGSWLFIVWCAWEVNS